jgi:hypothetical protein
MKDVSVAGQHIAGYSLHSSAASKIWGISSSDIHRFIDRICETRQ